MGPKPQQLKDQQPTVSACTIGEERTCAVYVVKISARFAFFAFCGQLLLRGSHWLASTLRNSTAPAVGLGAGRADLTTRMVAGPFRQREKLLLLTLVSGSAHISLRCLVLAGNRVSNAARH